MMPPAGPAAPAARAPRPQTLLGGRVQYRQLRDGYRTGIEPVLLAASVPARPGNLVVELGCGAGAGLLCLGARVPGLFLLGVEIEPRLAALARENLAANGRDGAVLRADAGRLPLRGGAHHAMANPPWHDDQGSLPADPLTARAKIASAGTLAAWVAGLCAALRPEGAAHMILPAAQAAAAAGLFAAAGWGGIAHRALLPRAGMAPKLAILHARRGAAPAEAAGQPWRELPPLILHDAAGYTEAAEAILRHGAALIDEG